MQDATGRALKAGDVVLVPARIMAIKGAELQLAAVAIGEDGKARELAGLGARHVLRANPEDATSTAFSAMAKGKAIVLADFDFAGRDADDVLAARDAKADADEREAKEEGAGGDQAGDAKGDADEKDAKGEGAAVTGDVPKPE